MQGMEEQDQRLILISPVKPLPAQSQGTSKSSETEYAKATPSFGTTHSFPIHKSHATRSVRFGAPQKIPSQLIYLFDDSVIQLEKGDEVYGDCREYPVYQLKASITR